MGKEKKGKVDNTGQKTSPIVWRLSYHNISISYAIIWCCLVYLDIKNCSATMVLENCPLL